MFISNKDLELLDDINFYLSELDGETAQRLNNELGSLLEKLEIKKIAKNMINTKRINEKRKIDRTYARPLKEKELLLT